MLKFAGVLIEDMRKGLQAAPHCDAMPARECPLCKALAVLPLDLATRLTQPDNTQAVCHPLLGGCNHGFEYVAKAYTFQVI